MSVPIEFTMNFNFKLVYTGIIHNIEISSHATVKDLFDNAREVFVQYINYHRYYIDYVIAGKGELASAFRKDNLHQPLWHEFNRWKQVSFYVRPVSRETDTFIRMDRYNEETQVPEVEEDVPEIQNSPRDMFSLAIPPPPRLTREIDRMIFI